MDDENSFVIWLLNALANRKVFIVASKIREYGIRNNNDSLFIWSLIYLKIYKHRYIISGIDAQRYVNNYS